MTHRDDVTEAVSSGADALGFVFYESSARYVTPEQASGVTQVPAFITRVGLFVDADEALVKDLPPCGIEPSAVPWQWLEFCDSVGLPYIKAFRVRSGIYSG